MLITIEADAVAWAISKLPTSQQRINARNKVKEIACKSIDEEILKKKDLLRSLRSESEASKRGIYADISKLEITKLEMLAGKYGF